MLKIYKTQSDTVKQLTKIYWFYYFIRILGDIFINIMIYDISKNIYFNLIYIMVKETGTTISVFLYSYITTKYQLNIKYSYKLYTFILFLSFITLFLVKDELYYILFYAFIYGTSIGIFFFTFHSYSLLKVQYEERDFFSSLVTLGTETVSILAPILIIISIYISQYLGVGDYNVMILMMILSSVIMLFFVKSLESLIPQQQTVKSLFKHINENKNKKALFVYNLFSGVRSLSVVVSAAYLSLEALNTAINIGYVEIFTGLLSIYVVAKMAKKRNVNDRIKIMIFASILIAIAYLNIIVFGISLLSYSIMSLLLIVAIPMYTTSMNVMDLNTMDMLKVDGKINYAIVYREFILYVGRIGTGLLMLGIYYLVDDSIVVVNLYLMITIISFIVMNIAATKLK